MFLFSEGTLCLYHFETISRADTAFCVLVIGRVSRFAERQFKTFQSVIRPFASAHISAVAVLGKCLLNSVLLSLL